MVKASKKELRKKSIRIFMNVGQVEAVMIALQDYLG